MTKSYWPEGCRDTFAQERKNNKCCTVLCRTCVNIVHKIYIYLRDTNLFNILSIRSTFVVFGVCIKTEHGTDISTCKENHAASPKLT